MNFIKRTLILLGLISAVSCNTNSNQPTTIINWEIERTPDAPVNFGYKICWFAIKTDNYNAVANVLKLTEIQPSNWASGLAVAYSSPDSRYSDLVFISPSISGWVFVISNKLPYPDKKQLSNNQNDMYFEYIFSMLYKNFDEVQFFGSHRVVSFITWAKAKNGKIECEFTFAEGNVYSNMGMQTTAEHSLNLLNLTGLSPDESVEAMFANDDKREHMKTELRKSNTPWEEIELQINNYAPISPDGDEELPLALASAWSINPMTLESLSLPTSLGIVGRLPSANSATQ